MRAIGHYSPLRAEVELRRLEGVMEYLNLVTRFIKSGMVELV